MAMTLSILYSVDSGEGEIYLHEVRVAALHEGVGPSPVGPTPRIDLQRLQIAI